MLANDGGVECRPYRSRTCDTLIKSQSVVFYAIHLIVTLQETTKYNWFPLLQEVNSVLKVPHVGPIFDNGLITNCVG